MKMEMDKQAILDDMSSDNFRLDSKYFLCRVIKRCLSSSTGYPYFSPRYVAHNIERPETRRSDLEEYKSTHSMFKSVVPIIFVLSSCCFTLQALILPMVQFKEMDMKNFSRNLERRPDGLIQFSCMLSNCSKTTLSALELSDKLLDLPYFSLCHPHLSAWHDVSQFCGINGIMFAVGWGVAVLVTGLLLPLITKLRPTGNLFLMFLVAPHVTRRVVENRSLELLCELEQSYRNYSESPMATRPRRITRKRCESDKVDYQRLAPSSRHSTSFKNSAASYPARCQHSYEQYLINSPYSLLRRRRKDFYPASFSPVHRFEYNDNSPLMTDQYRLSPKLNLESDIRPLNSSLCPEHREYARDCVTMMRSDWWHNKATSATWNLTTRTIGSLFVEILIFGLAVIYFVEWRRKFNKSIAEDLRQLNCSLWVNANSSPATIQESPRELQVDNLEIDFRLGLTSFFVVQFIWPMIVIDFFLSVYFLTNAELICWLYEIKLGLTLGAEFVRRILDEDKDYDKHSLSLVSPQKCEHPTRERAQTMSWEPRNYVELEDKAFRASFFGKRKKFDMNILRAKASQLIDLKVLLAIHKHPSLHQLRGTKSKLEASVATEKFVARKVLEHRMKLGAAVELLEKLYINFRIFAEHVNHHSGVMSTMLTFTNIYIYGAIIISVLFLRSIKDHALIPALVLSMGWILANFFVLLPSNLHAKAKGLHALIWTLAAITSGCRDTRLNHIRNLWIKQVTVLDSDGGLALKAYSMRITYVRIVQLIIGTGTLVVFALRL